MWKQTMDLKWKNKSHLSSVIRKSRKCSSASPIYKDNLQSHMESPLSCHTQKKHLWFSVTLRSSALEKALEKAPMENISTSVSPCPTFMSLRFSNVLS